MPIAGKLTVIPIPAERRWAVVVENEGTVPISITQNVLPPGQPDLNVHDDHFVNGHGLLTSPGKTSYQEFIEGSTYNGRKLTGDCILRLGLRGLAYHTLVLPDMDGGAVELDLNDFNWYGGTPETAAGNSTNWPGSAPHHSDVSGGEILDKVETLLAQARGGVRCEGEARVVAVSGPGNILSHWEVWFDNHSDQGFIGTVSLSKGNKNDGKGLESMAVPDKGDAAMQRIESMGNYGVIAKPGEKLRLGVRGYAWTEVELPSSGNLIIDVKKFKRDTSSMSAEYFEHDSLVEKREEKRERVQFFVGGKPLDGAIEPKVFRGHEAIQRSSFNPPGLRLWAVENSEDTPGGGWMLELENNLPQADDHGLLGFVASVRLAPAGVDGGVLPSRRFDFPNQAKRWFIPNGAELNGEVATTGKTLVVGTLGLGWQADVPLPAPGKEVDSSADDQLWGFREALYHRHSLSPAVTNRCRR